MNNANKIIDFFGNVINDVGMTPPHISLYVSLFQLWDMYKYETTFRICRKEVMKLSKIKSFATYHKCIKELHDAGFIIYSPTYNSYLGSSIEIIDLENDVIRKNKIVPDKSIVSYEEIYFTIPMLHEVEFYFKEHNLRSDVANQFYCLYQSKEWKLSNDKPMKCWKSAARNWISKKNNAKLNKDQNS